MFRVWDVGMLDSARELFKTGGLIAVAATMSVGMKPMLLLGWVLAVGGTSQQ